LTLQQDTMDATDQKKKPPKIVSENRFESRLNAYKRKSEKPFAAIAGDYCRRREGRKGKFGHLEKGERSLTWRLQKQSTKQKGKQKPHVLRQMVKITQKTKRTEEEKLPSHSNSYRRIEFTRGRLQQKEGTIRKPILLLLPPGD